MKRLTTNRYAHIGTGTIVQPPRTLPLALFFSSRYLLQSTGGPTTTSAGTHLLRSNNTCVGYIGEHRQSNTLSKNILHINRNYTHFAIFSSLANPSRSYKFRAPTLDALHASVRRSQQNIQIVTPLPQSLGRFHHCQRQPFYGSQT